MNLWILLAIVIESMACLGVLGVLVTKSTRPAFLAGFNSMILVAGIYVWFSPLPDPMRDYRLQHCKIFSNAC